MARLPKGPALSPTFLCAVLSRRRKPSAIFRALLSGVASRSAFVSLFQLRQPTVVTFCSFAKHPTRRRQQVLGIRKHNFARCLPRNIIVHEDWRGDTNTNV
jgi:hypothetical protein